MANGIVINIKILSRKTALVKSVLVKKCAQAFNEFGPIGINGIIEIRTTQQFKTTSAKIIRQRQFGHLKGSVEFALNGIVLPNSDLPIAIDAIEEIQLLKRGPRGGVNESLTGTDCICIWTLEPSERIATPGLCRGIRIKR